MTENLKVKYNIPGIFNWIRLNKQEKMEKNFQFQFQFQFYFMVVSLMKFEFITIKNIRPIGWSYKFYCITTNHILPTYLVGCPIDQTHLNKYIADNKTSYWGLGIAKRIKGERELIHELWCDYDLLSFCRCRWFVGC